MTNNHPEYLLPSADSTIANIVDEFLTETLENSLIDFPSLPDEDENPAEYENAYEHAQSMAMGILIRKLVGADGKFGINSDEWALQQVKEILAAGK